MPNAAIILIATKSDLRLEREKDQVVSYERGVKVAEEVGALRYIESCVWCKEDIKALHETIITVITEQNKEQRQRHICCCFM